MASQVSWLWAIMLLVIYYCMKSAYGYLLANVEDFCRQKNNSTTYEVNVGDIINTIQEDIYNPGALLAVVISNSKTSKPNSRLLRIHRNGDKEWVAGVSINLVDNYHSFPWISFFFQLSRTIILIADSKLRCIRSVDTSSGDVHIYSGNCSNQHPSTDVLLRKVKNGPIQNATFSQPDELYQPYRGSGRLLITDYNRIRELDLRDQNIYTLLSLSTQINSLIKKGDIYLVAISDAVHIYSDSWNFREELISKVISRQDFQPVENWHDLQPLDSPFALQPDLIYSLYVKGKVNMYTFGGYQMVDLGGDLVMLYFDINACPGCILKKLPIDQRAAAVLSITSKSLVFMLYDGISDKDVLSNYPITMASPKGKLIYFSTQDASVSPTFCSLLKTVNIIDFCLADQPVKSQKQDMHSNTSGKLTTISKTSECAITKSMKLSELKWYQRRRTSNKSCRSSSKWVQSSFYCLPKDKSSKTKLSNYGELVSDSRSSVGNASSQHAALYQPSGSTVTKSTDLSANLSATKRLDEMHDSYTRSTTYIVSTEISTNLKFYISIPLSLVIVGAIAVASVTYFCCSRKNRNMKSASQRSTHGGSNSHRPLPPTPRGDHEDSENPYYTTITSNNGHAIEIPDAKPGSLALIEPGTYVTGARMVDPDIDNHRTNLSWL